jgi:hypothetical protein
MATPANAAAGIVDGAGGFADVVIDDEPNGLAEHASGGVDLVQRRLYCDAKTGASRHSVLRRDHRRRPGGRHCPDGQPAGDHQCTFDHGRSVQRRCFRGARWHRWRQRGEPLPGEPSESGLHCGLRAGAGAGAGARQLAASGRRVGRPDGPRGAPPGPPLQLGPTAGLDYSRPGLRKSGPVSRAGQQFATPGGRTFACAHSGRGRTPARRQECATRGRS